MAKKGGPVRAGVLRGSLVKAGVIKSNAQVTKSKGLIGNTSTYARFAEAGKAFGKGMSAVGFTVKELEEAFRRMNGVLTPEGTVWERGAEYHIKKLISVVMDLDVDPKAKIESVQKAVEFGLISPSGVEVLMERVEKLHPKAVVKDLGASHETAAELLRSGIITPNEARKMLGLGAPHTSVHTVPAAADMLLDIKPLKGGFDPAMMVNPEQFRTAWDRDGNLLGVMPLDAKGAVRLANAKVKAPDPGGVRRAYASVINRLRRAHMCN